jgi:hypothetical protein
MKTLALALALSIAPAVSIAQTPSQPAPRRAAAQSAPVIRVEGVVSHPYYWVHTRSALHYQPAEARRAFAPTVVRAVRQSPF